MTGHSCLTRLTIISLVVMLLAIPFPALFANAGTVHHEGPDEFFGGQTENLDIGPEGLSLSGSNQSLFNNWTQLHSTGSPPARASPGMAFDSSHSEVVIFGGECTKGPMNDTWAYDLGTNNWFSKSPATSPPARQACGMAFDSKHGLVVLFGGYNDSDFLGDTWTYDLGTNVWKRMNPQTSPSARGHFVLAYDSANGVAVLFGGYNRNYLCDTWTYDVGADNWTNRGPAHSPSARSEYAMAHDSARGETVLFGGYIAGLFRDDTWTYNLTINDWTSQKPVSAPSACAAGAMVYDSSQGQMVLFGMYNFTQVNDTWTYDRSANAWTNRNPAEAPSARVYFGMAFDSARKKVILFGGGQNLIFSDTWTYDLAENIWTKMIPPGAPPARYGHAMVYDSAHKKAVLFGGWNENGFLNDTWAYDLGTNTWANMNPPTAPPARDDHAMVYDSIHDEVILFGGQSTYSFLDTWTYNLRTNSWTNRNPDNQPGTGVGPAMAFDSLHGEVVLFGGKDYAAICRNNTWAYNLSENAWTEMIPQTRPPARAFHSMVYDGARGDIVLFGGESKSGLLNDTWIYDLGANVWASQNPELAPSPREAFSMVYDSAHAEALLFGGFLGNVQFTRDDTWTYDPGTNNWTDMNPLIAPPARRYHAMVYDSASAATVLFGGEGSTGLLNDTWIYGSKPYCSAGDYRSAPRDTGGKAYFGTISWNAGLPAKTSLRFQFRSADTKANLTAKGFSGPNGTASSFYTINDQPINSKNNGARWFQYRAFFSTDDVKVTPLLRGVTINYNLLQELAVVSPAGGENWTGLQNITWMAADKDNDSLSFDIFLENATVKIPLAQNLPDGARSFQFNTSLVPNGTYRIRIVARDDNPAIPLTVSAVSADFTIHHPMPPYTPNRPPHVWLVSPLNNSIVNTTSVRLAWLGTDPDNDPLTYTVNQSCLPFPNGSTNHNTTSLDHLDMIDLADNTTYYWTVDAGDGTNDHTDVPADVWSFTVRLPQQPPINHPPRITSTPPTNATEGVEYLYNVTAEDPENDPLAFSLASAVQGMAIDPVSGRLSWTPDAAQARLILVRVSDGRGGADEQAFNLTVRRSAPTCSITYPADGAKLSGTVNITGIATRGFRALQNVEVRIDGGNWTPADKLESWKFALDTRALANGQHTITARAYDGRYYSDNATVAVTVDNAAPKPVRPDNPTIAESPCPWFILVVIIVIIGGVSAIYYKNRKTV